jgi:cytochrome c oxidase subunit III
METKIKPSPTYKQDLEDARQKTAKPLLWIGIVSIVMLFAGLTSAYIVRADNGNWLLFNLPDMFYISTALILTSSITLFAALQAAKKNNYGMTTAGVLATFILGIAFCFTQFAGWSELYAKGVVFAGKYSNASGSFLYVLTGLHMAHLAGGLIALLVTLVNALRKKYNAENLLGLELCSIYWHFLDILWVYLFLFLYYIR